MKTPSIYYNFEHANKLFLFPQIIMECKPINQQKIGKIFHITHNYILYLEVSYQTMSENETVFNPFFNGFHSSTLVQVIGNKSADLGLFFSQK
jgi:hypothetical protein